MTQAQTEEIMNRGQAGGITSEAAFKAVVPLKADELGNFVGGFVEFLLRLDKFRVLGEKCGDCFIEFQVVKE